VGSYGCLEHLLVKRVYIIIVNWNGWRDTVECLESLLHLEYEPVSVVVCDNGSEDESIDEFKKWSEIKGCHLKEYSRSEAEAGGDLGVYPWLVLIRNGENLGFAGANNVGLRYACAHGDFSYAWLLNNDTVVDKGALGHLITRISQHSSIGMCGSTLLQYRNPKRIQALGGGYYCRWIGLPFHFGRFMTMGHLSSPKRAEAWMNYVEGASLLVSREFLDAIGLMNEEYFLYFEEADWAIRAKGRFSLAYASESIVYHKIGASIGTSSNPLKKSPLCDYYSIRNRLLFTRRYHPVALPSIYLTLCGALLLRLLSGKWSQAVMIVTLLRGSKELQSGLVRGHWKQT
jgi:GT2 family glycosyltransferase